MADRVMTDRKAAANLFLFESRIMTTITAAAIHRIKISHSCLNPSQISEKYFARCVAVSGISLSHGGSEVTTYFLLEGGIKNSLNIIRPARYPTAEVTASFRIACISSPWFQSLIQSKRTSMGNIPLDAWYVAHIRKVPRVTAHRYVSVPRSINKMGRTDMKMDNAI